MKKEAEERVEKIRKEASQRVTDNIVKKVKEMSDKEVDLHYAEFVKLNFEMMYELGLLGVVLGQLTKGNDGKMLYQATLPYQFKITDEDGKVYTHFTAAQKAKKIITEYRKRVGPMVLGDEDPENFNFCYNMRDDVWDEERSNRYSALIKEEVDNATKVLEELAKENEG